MKLAWMQPWPSGWQIRLRSGTACKQNSSLRDQPEIVLDDDMQAILFRNVRELLTNVVRHAQANKVSVHVERAWPP